MWAAPDKPDHFIVDLGPYIHAGLLLKLMSICIKNGDKIMHSNKLGTPNRNQYAVPVMTKFDCIPPVKQ